MIAWKRLLAFLPTIFIVLLFLLWVQQFYNAQSNIPVEEFHSTEDQLKLLEAAYAIEGLNKPIFYISVFPRILNTVEYNKVERLCQKKLLRAGMVAQDLDMSKYPGIANLYHCQQRNCVLEWAQNQEQLAIRSRQFLDLLPVFQWNKDNQFASLLRDGLGRSSVDGQAAKTKIFQALRWTIVLNSLVVLLSFSLGVSLGLYSAVNEKHWIQRIIQPSIFFFYTLPSFVLATLLVIFLTSDYYGLQLFPQLGYWEYVDATFFGQIWANRIQFLAPIICITLPIVAYIARILQESVAHELRQKYVWFARIRGSSIHTILWKHVLPNIRYPIAALASNVPVALVSGMIVVEVITNFPGIGRLLYTSVLEGDWSVVRGIVILTTIMGFLGLFITDLFMQFWQKKTG